MRLVRGHLEAVGSVAPRRLDVQVPRPAQDHPPAAANHRRHLALRLPHVSEGARREVLRVRDAVVGDPHPERAVQARQHARAHLATWAGWGYARLGGAGLLSACAGISYRRVLGLGSWRFGRANGGGGGALGLSLRGNF